MQVCSTQVSDEWAGKRGRINKSSQHLGQNDQGSPAMTIARWDWRNSRGQLVSPLNLDIRKAKQSLAQHHVRYVLAQFVDIYGAAKSKAVPGEHVEAHSPAPRICTRDGNPAGITTQTPVLSARLDPVLSGGRLANYLKAMTLEAQTTARVCGKNQLHNLEPEDLAALTIEAAAMARLPLAGMSWISGVV